MPNHAAKSLRGPARVLVVDDSALMRRLLTEVLSRDPGLTVVGVARDPLEARQKIKELSPDVLTLDVEMPHMDGLSFLSNLMRLRPMPVVMVSSLTEEGADTTLAALDRGAVDFVAKPRLDAGERLEDIAAELVDKVKSAALAKVRERQTTSLPSPRVAPPLPSKLGAAAPPSVALIALGASTGGTEALAELLAAFPPDAPGTVIAQHIPEMFSGRFANRLDQQLPLSVAEAREGEAILDGHVYVAPGNHHLRVARVAGRYVCRVTQDELVNRHRPSVDVLFRSVAEQVGPAAVGALLTGMGADGAEGLLAMFRAGAHTLAQDQATSVVWGMPREAVERGAAREVLPLTEIAPRLLRLARKHAPPRS